MRRNQPAETHASTLEQAFQVPRLVRERRSKVMVNQELTAGHGSCCRAVAALWYRAVLEQTFAAKLCTVRRNATHSHGRQRPRLRARKTPSRRLRPAAGGQRRNNMNACCLMGGRFGFA